MKSTLKAIQNFEQLVYVLLHDLMSICFRLLIARFSLASSASGPLLNNVFKDSELAHFSHIKMSHVLVSKLLRENHYFFLTNETPFSHERVALML